MIQSLGWHAMLLMLSLWPWKNRCVFVTTFITTPSAAV